MSLFPVEILFGVRET